MRKSAENVKWGFVGLLMVAAIFVWYAVFTETGGNLKVAFLDVGQGDAIFIQSPNGNQVLIDGGPNKAVLRELSKIMPFYDRSIDLVIESHPDSDHIAGLVDVLKRYDVGAVVESGVETESAIYSELELAREKKDVPKILARNGMRINFNDGAYFDILFPDRDVFDFEPNDASVVGKLVYGENSFLLTGDSPKKIEKYLVSLYGKGLAVDVLKTGHHGSHTSTAESFLGYANPKYAVISVGKDNSYGHPRAEVLDLLSRFEAKVLRTDEQGTIVMESDGDNVVVAD